MSRTGKIILTHALCSFDFKRGSYIVAFIYFNIVVICTLISVFS